MKQLVSNLIAVTMVVSATLWADELEVTDTQQNDTVLVTEELLPEIEVISEEQLADEKEEEVILEETTEEEVSLEQEETEVILEDGTSATELEVTFVTALLKNLVDTRPYAFQTLVKKAFNVEVKFSRFTERKLKEIGILQADGSFAEHVQDIILAKTRINDEGKAELIGYEGKTGGCKHRHGRHHHHHGKGHGHGHHKGKWHHRFR
ncbi:MAG: hypothetical protein Q8K75_03965 [Chlamydiales bacterium]|nr:hypothetical protein [Chlamydiales bacterium]